jgi:hypothetical protein
MIRRSGKGGARIVTTRSRTGHRHHFVSNPKSIDRYQDILQLTISGRRKDLPSLALNGEAHLRECQSILFNHLYGSTRLSTSGFDEFQTSWHGSKEVTHRDRGTRARGGERHHTSLPKAHGYLRSSLLGPAPAEKRYLRHRTYAGQRLASKAKRTDLLQIGQMSDLTGSMSGKGKWQLRSRYAAAIVAESDKLQTSMNQLDSHLPGTGIQSILYKLLHHRGRPLDHLARRDLGGDIRC